MLCSWKVCSITAILAMSSIALPVAAQTPEASSGPNNAYFEDATIVGGTNSITITRVPVSAGGKTYYRDITIPFLVASDGSVIAQPLDEVTSVVFIDSALEAGTYAGPATVLSGQAKIALAGPSVFENSYTEWTVSSISGAAGCTYPASGAFYVVPALSDNPIYSRLQKANITSMAWFYGTDNNVNCYNQWPPNGIIGVSQVGNTLTIASFSDNVGDHPNPVAQITYTLTK